MFWQMQDDLNIYLNGIRPQIYKSVSQNKFCFGEVVGNSFKLNTNSANRNKTRCKFGLKQQNI